MFNFTIKYQTGHSNRATDELSHHPFNPSCDFDRETDSNEVEVISYSLVSEAVDQHFNSSQIPDDLKQEVQDIRYAVQSTVVEEERRI